MADDQVVIITGASRGFGAAAARLIASRGNTVVATMRNPDRDGPAVVNGFEDRIVPAQLDVLDGAAAQRIVREIASRFGRIDALVNNAGYGLFGAVEDVSEEELWRQVDTNLLGQWRMARAVLPIMRAQARGKIINVSSTAGRMPAAVIGMYCASKHAVEAMSESLRFEVANAGVQVCIIEPGMFASDWQTSNLDVCAAIREVRSPYQATVERFLDGFRQTAATRPGSASVAAAMADAVELEQRLPMRWPVGNDAVHMLPIHKASSDELWQFLRQSGALGNWRRPLYENDPPPPAPPDWRWARDNVVLITGASRGFGAAAAREIASRGNTVIATMRNPERDAAAVAEGYADRIHPVALDVTDRSMVSAVVEEAIGRFGRIDAVINNAGYGLYGPVEDFTEDEVRRQLDTNFLGQWRVLKAVLPHMRARRLGKIVNMSSLSGQVPSPLMGFYAASKHAVEAMSEALAEEVAPWNVQATILQPGMYHSDWQTTNLDVCAAVREGRSDYQAGVERSLKAFRALAASRPGSDAVAAAMADIVQLQQPLPLRWPIGNDAIALMQDRKLLSDTAWERQAIGWGWGFAKDEVRTPAAVSP
jgi:NAD(P)-dependent dehydrogenase (short-subunit alcohol dehydrogenase family)